MNNQEKRDQYHEFIRRAYAYIGEMFDLNDDFDFREMIHHSGHVEQEMRELSDLIRKNK